MGLKKITLNELKKMVLQAIKEDDETNFDRIKSDRNVNFGDGYTGGIDRVTTTDKSGIFLRFFAKKREGDIEFNYYISTMYKKDGTIHFIWVNERKYDYLESDESDGFMYEKEIRFEDIPDAIIEYIKRNISEKIEFDSSYNPGAPKLPKKRRRRF